MAISGSALRNLLKTFPDNAKVLGFAEGLIVMTSDTEGKLVILNAPLCVPDQDQIRVCRPNRSQRNPIGQ
jgi:hypothetical protein